MVDSLSLIEDFLIKNNNYSSVGFAQFLLSSVKNYNGLLGTFSFDRNGNSDLGFSLDRIKYIKNK